MTSSAASETLQGQEPHGGSAVSSAGARREHLAPRRNRRRGRGLAGPAGRWTSSRTTSGREPRTAATPPLTSAASPTTSRPAVGGEVRADARADHAVVVDDQDPDVTAHRPGRQAQGDLGAAVGRAAHARGPAGAPHPADDRLPHAQPVVRDGLQVETRTAVAHEHLHRARGAHRLRVHRHRPAARAARRSAAPRGRPGPATSGACPGPGCRGRPRRRPRRARPTRPRPRSPRPAARRPAVPARLPVVAVQPLPQLALLRRASRATSVVSPDALLDEGERLQHRVVHVGGELGPLLLPRQRRALVAEVLPQPHRPRRQHDGRPHEDAQARQGRAPRTAPGPRR